METAIYIDPHFLQLTFEHFEKFHKKHLAHDSLTAKQRWVKAGGTLPPKSKK